MVEGCINLTSSSMSIWGGRRLRTSLWQRLTQRQSRICSIASAPFFVSSFVSSFNLCASTILVGWRQHKGKQPNNAKRCRCTSCVVNPASADLGRLLQSSLAVHLAPKSLGYSLKRGSQTWNCNDSKGLTIPQRAGPHPLKAHRPRNPPGSVAQADHVLCESDDRLQGRSVVPKRTGQGKDRSTGISNHSMLATWTAASRSLGLQPKLTTGPILCAVAAHLALLFLSDRAN